MKKLLAHELVFNRLEILVDARGKTQFILARRLDKDHGDTYWQLFKDNELLATSAYRLDLYSGLEGFIVKSA